MALLDWLRTGLAAVVLASAPAVAEPVPEPHPAKLVGTYDGRQMEMAAGLELSADGRFRYGLSYGALDETSAGTWRFDGTAVRLTSDPVTPPQFVLLGQAKGKNGQLTIALDLPKGLSRQYFDALVTFTDGTTKLQQFAEEGLTLAIAKNQQVQSVRLILQVYELASEPVAVANPAGATLQFRFEPHDIGKVAFADLPLRIEDGALILEHLGRTVRFRK